MRRMPVLVVAVLAGIVFVGAARKFVLRLHAASRTAAAPPQPPGFHRPVPVRRTGLGAGAPPLGVAGNRGARTLHGDARHAGRAAGSAPRSLPSTAWSHDVGGPVEAQITTSPDESTLYVVTLAGSLTALAADDGTVRFSLGLGDRGYGAPCVANDGTLFVGSDAKRFFSVSPDGRLKWYLDTDGDADTAAALASDDSIVFAAGRMLYDVTRDGQVKWRFAAKRKIFTAPAVASSGKVFFGSQDHRAYALSSDGRLVWTTDLASDVDGAPAIADDGSVFMGTDGGEVVRLNPDDGAVAWRTAVGGYVRGTLSITRNGDVLAGVYGPMPRTVRLRASDGALLGQLSIQGTGARDFGVHGGPLEDDNGTLLFGTQDDRVYAIDASGGLLWSFTTGGDVDAPITLLSDGTVVVGSDDGFVRALRASR